ncbi:MAG: hypothetical protein R2788_24790 [Saprospiraceae bacterium]
MAILPVVRISGWRAKAYFWYWKHRNWATLCQRLFPKKQASKSLIYISGNNLVTITAHKGLDPEVGASFGVDRGFILNQDFISSVRT